MFGLWLQLVAAIAGLTKKLDPKQAYAIHKPHLPSGGATVYRGICGEQFHGSNASYSSTDEACGNRSSTWRSHV